ncbi:PnuC-like nicotinamide mononucleotide transport [Pectobacterium phage vB_PcaM_CBB]|uniref:Nicotinamide mononucleotide transporter PnuC n=1 Tax=Pectobacterium phage vB_PcaM_CBB TaxID=2772511 RepID=A0A1L2CV72_9CAUD|nr:PnuC-like nicotinamide mononucleotide transport [Pectobacterium phage vB_PcaM_CBB]AMM43925.1 nicotinamide mononucleotide transporter PnuC [Pectobacterium phage vB_PcaM_CBB]
MNALVTSLNLSPTLLLGYILFLTTVCGIYIYRIAGTDLKLSQVFSTCVTDFKGWTVKEYLWLFTAPAIICAVSLIMGGGWVEFVCSVTSIIGAILVAKGKISSYVWGFVGTALYLYISYKYKLYGETITYALLFLPMQVSGYYYWIVNSKEKDTDVIKKVMTTKQRIWLFAGTGIAIAAYAAFLRYLEGATPGLDSATSILSIVATTLMVKRYAEQWLIWILVNTVAIVMWVLAVLHHQDQGFAVLTMWITFWLNSVYGWYQWRKGN